MFFDALAFISVVGDAIVAVDCEGKIILWNASAQRIFGYMPDEVVGRSLDLIIPERYRTQHWLGFRRVMKAGQTRLGTSLLYVTACRKCGDELKLALTVGVLRSDQGVITSIGAIFRERVEQERHLAG